MVVYVRVFLGEQQASFILKLKEFKSADIIQNCANSHLFLTCSSAQLVFCSLYYYIKSCILFHEYKLCWIIECSY